MKKELFFDEMEKALKVLKPEEMEIIFKRINKQNRMGLHGCTLSMPESAAAPTFYLEDLYEAYLSGTATEDIAQSMINFARENILPTAPGGIDIEDYESVRQKLGLVVIGEDKNREYLEELVYEKVEDLALIPVIVTNDRNGVGVIKIRKELLTMWGVTAREILTEAKKNAPKSMPPVFKRMGDIIQENLGVESLPEEDREEGELFVVSNEHYLGGAAVAFYPGFLESIAKALNRDFFVLPSSVNEMILLRDLGQNPLELLQIVTTVNRTQVAPEEVLADAVYYYSRSGEFRKILPMKEVLA